MEIQPHRLVGPALEYAGLADLNWPVANSSAITGSREDS